MAKYQTKKKFNKTTKCIKIEDGTFVDIKGEREWGEEDREYEREKRKIDLKIIQLMFEKKVITEMKRSRGKIKEDIILYCIKHWLKKLLLLQMYTSKGMRNMKKK